MYGREADEIESGFIVEVILSAHGSSLGGTSYKLPETGLAAPVLGTGCASIGII